MLENLLKITKQEIGGASVVKHKLTDTVDARELHKGLLVQTPFGMWVKRRMSKTMFQEAYDYEVHKVVHPKNTGVSIESKEYIMSLEMAKHFAMMENTPRGYQVRGYFIECETSLKEITDYLGLRHNDSMSKVKRMAESQSFGTLREIRIAYNTQGQLMNTYLLDKRQMMAVSGTLSVDLQMMLVDRVNEICVESFFEVTEHFNFRILLEGESKVGNNWKETH